MNAKSNVPSPPNMPGGPPSNATEGEFFREVEKSRERYRAIRLGMILFAVVAVVFIGHLAIMDLAGKNTHADFKWEVVASWGRALPWGLVAIFVTWAMVVTGFWREAAMRAENYQTRLLELQMDRDRTFPGLPPTGDTDPNDGRF